MPAQNNAHISARRGSERIAARDAIEMLEADHRDLERLFKSFEAAKANLEQKQDIVAQIAKALRVHAQIEEEIFYSEAKGRIGDDEINEAIVEHGAAEMLLAEIEAMDVGEPFYDAKVKVLQEEIEHHVHEEEDETFPELRETDMDMAAIGEKMSRRQAQLIHEF
jgi:hypothetical protein